MVRGVVYRACMRKKSSTWRRAILLEDPPSWGLLCPARCSAICPMTYMNDVLVDCMVVRVGRLTVMPAGSRVGESGIDYITHCRKSGVPWSRGKPVRDDERIATAPDFTKVYYGFQGRSAVDLWILMWPWRSGLPTRWRARGLEAKGYHTW